MRTADFDYPLPPELIAQAPAERRDESRLLVWRRSGGARSHRQFRDLPEYLREGDVLVMNDSRVIPARLRAVAEGLGREFELLLLEENARNDWWAMARPGRRARPGTEITVRDRAGALTDVRAVVAEVNGQGHRRLRFAGPGDVGERLGELGETPLPPYIERASPNLNAEDDARYQTVYARAAGSVAAPTAGLHFTPELLSAIRARGVETRFVTLHVGPGTFAPVKAESLDAHVMHEERYSLDADTARDINEARQAGRRIIAVGTTSVRVLESAAAAHGGRLAGGSGRTRIFIRPPGVFQAVDGLVTNFHLPCSTLLMLVAAFAAPGETSGREAVLEAYAEAVRERYRFFSYGDAMLIL